MFSMKIYNWYVVLLLFLLPSLTWSACPGTPSDCYIRTGSDPYTYTAIDCSYDAVNQSVQAADDGDTVSVPACDETTWGNSQLLITKAIILQGAGVGVTNIRTTYTSGAIAYIPTTPSTDHRFRVTGFTLRTAQPYSASGLIYLYHTTPTTWETIRIDHNYFEIYKVLTLDVAPSTAWSPGDTITDQHSHTGVIVEKLTDLTYVIKDAYYDTGFTLGDILTNGTYSADQGASYPTLSYGSRGAYVNGSFIGSIDNNTFKYCAVSFYGDDGDSWDAFEATRAYGNVYNLYFEDNIVYEGGHGSGQGGRYVSRYNTYNFDSTSDVMEFHGNQPGGVFLGETPGGNASTMITEIYGNHFNLGASGAGNLVDQRGGWSLLFMNKITEGVNSSYYAREEVADYLYPLNNTYDQHVTNAYSWGNISTKQGLLKNNINSDENCCASDPVAWQAFTAYGSDLTCKRWTNDSNDNCWKSCASGVCGTNTGTSGEEEPNWEGTTQRNYLIDGGIRWLNMGVGTPIIETVDWFTQKVGTFDGTGVAGGGVGCGTLAALQEAAYYTSCTTGVGYWATSQGNCSDLTGYVGDSSVRTSGTATKLEGTLYKCNATGDGWDAYYTPYDYPHPLRGEGGGTTGPSVTLGSGASMSIGSGAVLTLQ
jgi:hypothetical protein